MAILTQGHGSARARRAAWLLTVGSMLLGCGSGGPTSSEDVESDDPTAGSGGSTEVNAGGAANAAGSTSVTSGGGGAPEGGGMGGSVTGGGGTTTVQVTPDSGAGTRVGRYTVLEIVLPYPEAGIANVWEDVKVSAVFKSPSGQDIAVRGFYHSTDTWKVRFAPWELGHYAYHVTIARGANEKAVDGSFEGVASAEKGFVRASATNPLRLVFEDGSLYNALGMGSCVQDPATPHWGLDGGDRSKGEPEATTDVDTYLKAMAGVAKLNIYRWSVNNCAFELWQTIAPTGNRYLVKEGGWGDALVTKMRQYGLRVYMDFFGWKPMYGGQWQDQASMDAVKRYVDYVVARYGAYVDFWEVCNESSPPGQWISLVADYVKSIDPYHHMVSSSWERPDLAPIGISSPHWYEKEAELASDTRTIEKIEPLRKYNKPIIFGEQGNSVQNWDPLSSLRARIRSWTAFFDEGHFVFWESNFAKDYKSGAANLYFGPDVRQFFNVLQTFTGAVPPDVTRQTVTALPQGAARAYGLKSADGFYVYLRDAQGYTSARTGVTIAVTLDKPGHAQFIDTKTGSIAAESDVPAGPNTITVPSFVADSALAIKYAK